MWHANPDTTTRLVAYVASQQAQERYYREEGIPARRLTDLVPNDADVLAGVRRVVQAVRGALTALSLSRRRRPGVALPGAGQGAAAK
jgi:hypothetical protein